MREPRPHQREAIEATEEQWASGATRTTVVMATGLGKSDVIASIATQRAALGQRGLILAHRDELLNQLTDRIRMYNPRIPVGRVQGARNETRRLITVASTPTLARPARRARMKPPEFVIMDECHHAASPSNMDILRWAGSFDQVPTLGVTATLVRGDKRKLGDVWQSLAYERDTAWGVEHGWLVRPRARVVVTDHMDLEHAKISKGDFQERELGEMVTQDAPQIVKAWQEHAADRITVVFAPSVDACKALAQAFADQGVPVGEVYGTTPLAQRAKIYADLAAGRIRALINCMVATEGWDCPEVSCVVVARPTRLAGLYAQMVGRGLRLSPGKTDCLVLDVVGASRHQRLVSLVDLLPSAEVDAREIEALPCGDCGAPKDLCECAPPERGPAQGPPRLFGEPMYEDIDLFSQSTCNWLFTKKGLRFLGVGDRIAVLWPLQGQASSATQHYSIGHCRAGATLLDYADGEFLDDHVPHTLEEAKAIAERWALSYNEPAVSRLRAREHGRSPLKRDVAAWEGRIRGAAAMTRGRLADEIDVWIASRLLDQGLA